jgi:hypothetical protein
MKCVGKVQKNFSLPVSAAKIIEEEVGPNARTHGAFVARLLYEWKARQEERARIAHEQATAAANE